MLLKARASIAATRTSKGSCTACQAMYANKGRVTSCEEISATTCLPGPGASACSARQWKCGEWLRSLSPVFAPSPSLPPPANFLRGCGRGQGPAWAWPGPARAGQPQLPNKLAGVFCFTFGGFCFTFLLMCCFQFLGCVFPYYDSVFAAFPHKQ